MPQAMRSATRLRLLLSLGFWKFSSQQPLGEPVGKFSKGMNISYIIYRIDMHKYMFVYIYILICKYVYTYYTYVHIYIHILGEIIATSLGPVK